MSELLFLAAVAGLAISSAAQSPPPPPSPTESAEKQENVGSVKDQPSSNTSSPTQTFTPNVNQSHAQPAKETADNEANANRNETPFSWSNLLTVIFTGVLTGVGILQWISMRKQAGYMRRGLPVSINAAKSAKFSAKAAQRSIELAHLDQRAWVAPNVTAAECVSNQPLRVIILLKNTGKTFAKQCFISSDFATKFLSDTDPDFDKLVQDAEKVEVGIVAPKSDGQSSY